MNMKKHQRSRGSPIKPPRSDVLCAFPRRVCINHVTAPLVTTSHDRMVFNRVHNTFEVQGRFVECACSVMCVCRCSAFLFVSVNKRGRLVFLVEVLRNYFKTSQGIKTSSMATHFLDLGSTPTEYTFVHLNKVIFQSSQIYKRKYYNELLIRCARIIFLSFDCVFVESVSIFFRTHNPVWNNSRAQIVTHDFTYPSRELDKTVV